jgi:amino acid transporter
MTSRNYTIQYLPIPISDIIVMKITERDRIEKVQILTNKVISNIVSFFLYFVLIISSIPYVQEINREKRI